MKFIRLLAVVLCSSKAALGISDEEADYAVARSLWDSLNHDTYGYGFKRDCFCPPAYRAPLRVNVENNDWTSVTTWTGENTTEGAADAVKTVSELFEEIRSSLDNDVCSMNVVYNHQWGYPEDVSIDYDCRIADDEYHVRIQNVTLYSSLEDSLDEAQSLWASADIHTYNYLYTHNSADVEVEVIDGIVNRVVAIDPGTAVLSRSTSNDNDQIPTIMGLFDLIREAINEKAFRIEAEYDGTQGYPSRIFIDYAGNISGDELVVLGSQVRGSIVPKLTSTVPADMTAMVDQSSIPVAVLLDESAISGSAAPELSNDESANSSAASYFSLLISSFMMWLSFFCLITH